MSNERPPVGDPRLTGANIGASASNDVEGERQVPEAGLASSDKEFGFSHLVLGEQIPFALPQQAVERTWTRLSKTSALGVGAAAPLAAVNKRLTGPLVAFAACAATFAAGVWVGEGNGGLGGSRVASPRVLTAEPVGIALPGSHGLGNAARVEESIQTVGRGTAGAVSLPDLPAAQADATDTPHVVGATRGTHGVRPAVNLTPGASAGSGVLPPPVHTSEVVVVMTPNAVGGPGWQRLANDGDYEGALVEIGAAGGFERILQSASAEQLMLLSDVARGTGQQQRALAALRRIVSEHASDPVAPLAALNMGNLLDKMGDGAAATQAFAVYRALSPQGEFAEDAFVRELRSAVSAGQQDVARRLVRQYETNFPEGRRADEVARWAEQIPTQSESGDAGTALSESPQ